jgi:hypothetical protein
MTREWWPGGTPARVWADRFLRRQCTREGVPEPLHELVRRHVEIARERKGFDRKKNQGSLL